MLIGGAVAAAVLAPLTALLLADADPPPSPVPTPAVTAAPAASPSAAPALDCVYLPAGEPARAVTPPAAVTELPDGPTRAVLRTSVGPLVLELLPESAPCAVHSFRSLVAQGFYDGTPCHRLVEQGIQVLHCGDPTGTGTGGPGYEFQEEVTAETRYRRGTVALVNSGPGTSGSQFFLVYDTSALPAQYTVFGQLTEASLAFLDALVAPGAAPPDEFGNTAPKLPVTIRDAELLPAS